MIMKKQFKAGDFVVFRSRHGKSTETDSIDLIMEDKNNAVVFDTNIKSILFVNLNFGYKYSSIIDYIMKKYYAT